MEGLAEVAHLVGMEWAERMFTILENREDPIPKEWPGTAAEARAIAESYAANMPDREWLAQQVQLMAEDAWQDFVSVSC